MTAAASAGANRATHSELARELAHMSAAVFAAFLPLVISFREIAVLCLAFAAVMAGLRRAHMLSAIHGVSRAEYGDVFFALGIAALATVCPHTHPFLFGVLVLVLGKDLAAFVGGKLGRRLVPLVQAPTSLWASGTFLLSCFVLGAVLMVAAGISVQYALIAAAAIALALTPVELVLTHGLDNLVLPPLAGLLAMGL